MLKQKITVLCHSNVGGPNGRLFANHVYELDDCEYVRTLIKSENVSLIDPPSLDPAYLEGAGYELCDGYVYSEGNVFGPEDEVPEYQIFGIKEGSDPVETSNTIPEDIHENVPEEGSKNSNKTSEEPSVKVSDEKDDSHEGGVQE